MERCCCSVVVVVEERKDCAEYRERNSEVRRSVSEVPNSAGFGVGEFRKSKYIQWAQEPHSEVVAKDESFDRSDGGGCRNIRPPS